jgi:hypothetical protein
MLTAHCRELQMQQQECVRYIIQLEQWLMEGAYNKVLLIVCETLAPGRLMAATIDDTLLVSSPACT